MILEQEIKLFTDEEIIRFTNGIIAALETKGPKEFCSYPRIAKKLMPELLQQLATQSMSATVGYKGTAIIHNFNSNKEAVSCIAALVGELK